MSTNIMYPNIDSKSESGQLVQIRSYLHQLVEQLNFALGNIDFGQSQNTSGVGLTNVSSSVIGSANSVSNQDTSRFNSIKSLIIKNAEIVDAFYQEISDRLRGSYVAQSEFGTYKQETEAAFKKSSLGLEMVLSEDQDIESAEYTTLRKSNAWLKIGKVDEINGWPLYGMEVGQYGTEINEDGMYTEQCSARYTTAGVELYGDNSDVPVVKISGSTLEIGNITINMSLKFGGYLNEIDSNGGVVGKWLGGIK